MRLIGFGFIVASARTTLSLSCSVNSLDDIRGTGGRDAGYHDGASDSRTDQAAIDSAGWPDSGSDVGDGTGGSGCGVGEKACGGVCVSTSDPANGCAAADCSPCSIDHGSATCTNGLCAVKGCDSGYGNCDADAQNGCETALGSDVNCSKCGEACSAPIGTAACVGGVCKVTSCPSLRADCDGAWQNGCETDLTTPASCAACGVTCVSGFTCAKTPSGNYICACSGDASCLNGGVCYFAICVCGSTACALNQRCTLASTCF